MDVSSPISYVWVFFWLLVFQVFQFKCPSALNCCTFLSENEAAGGSEDGTLWLIDIRFPRLVSFNTGQQRTRLFIFLGVQKKYFIKQNSSSRCCETFCRRGLSCIKISKPWDQSLTYVHKKVRLSFTQQ